MATKTHYRDMPYVKLKKKQVKKLQCEQECPGKPLQAYRTDDSPKGKIPQLHHALRKLRRKIIQEDETTNGKND